MQLWFHDARIRENYRNQKENADREECSELLRINICRRFGNREGSRHLTAPAAAGVIVGRRDSSSLREKFQVSEFWIGGWYVLIPIAQPLPFAQK